MLRTLKIMRISYPDIKVPQWQGRRLRGFFGADQEAGSLLHNHGEEGTIYRYPFVQYKVIGGTPTILAIEDGISAVYPLAMEHETLTLGQQVYDCGNMQFDLCKERAGDTDEPLHYRFVSPWFALNQANYRLYQEAESGKQAQLLNRILTGNLLSFSKALGITVENRLKVESNLKSCMVQFKNDHVISFWGNFSVNYELPDLIGLGKSISRGFGTVRKRLSG